MMPRIAPARGVAVAVVVLAAGGRLSAQGVDGYVSIMGDVLPAVMVQGTERGVAELRARLFAERRVDVGERFRFTAAGFAEGLIADRQQGAVTTGGIIRPQELHLEAVWAKADLRVGISRIVWGRLDEFLPTDVVNPQDLARFFLEGRSEGRMPVGMVRARLLPSDRFAVEAIYVPVFRRGRFDQLDEDTSPFNVSPLAALVTHRPPAGWRGAQGGARASVTSGRVDWSVSAYRGFEPLPVYDGVHERFPRYTMLGGDFETVRGAWGVRGEIAAFVDRTLQAIAAPVTARGHAVEGGLGVDRKAGSLRVSGNVVLARRAAGDAAIDRTDVTIVGAVDRAFARETRTLRALGVYNPREDSAFVRLIATFSLRDNLSLESSGGWFAGDGVDALSRLATRDFLYARLKVFF